MKSFKFYNDLEMTKEERKVAAKKGMKQALFLLFICPLIVLAVAAIIFLLIVFLS